MGRWKFLTNHALVLILLANHPKITGRELSELAGITERTVRKIIADLEAEGYVEKVREGRGTRYSINPRLPLRHPAQRDREIGVLLEGLGWKPGL